MFSRSSPDVCLLGFPKIRFTVLRVADLRGSVCSIGYEQEFEFYGSFYHDPLRP